VFLFFKRFSAGFLDAQSYRKDTTIDNQVLTFQDVTDAFGRVAPIKEPNVKN